MPSIQGPAVFLAQFLRDEPPYDNLENIGAWVAGLGYNGIQIPAWDPRVIDLDQASQSVDYCDEYRGRLNEMGLEPTELAPFLQGQVLAMHPAYEVGFEAFHPPGLRGAALTEWASEEIKKCIVVSQRLGLDNIAVLSGGFVWHMVYPWPQRPAGVIEEAFGELARRWRPYSGIRTAFAFGTSGCGKVVSPDKDENPGKRQKSQPRLSGLVRSSPAAERIERHGVFTLPNSRKVSRNPMPIHQMGPASAIGRGHRAIIFMPVS